MKFSSTILTGDNKEKYRKIAFRKQNWQLQIYDGTGDFSIEFSCSRTTFLYHEQIETNSATHSC
jgi:hypothetical protein